MTLLLKAVVSISTHENGYWITFLSKNTVGLRFFMIASFLKSVHFILKTSSWTIFSTPIPAVPHLVVFGFNPEKSENDLNSLER